MHQHFFCQGFSSFFLSAVRTLSWEIELSVLTGQCLNRRIGTDGELSREITAWEQVRNRAGSKIDWRFTTSDARIKLRKLYPTIKTPVDPGKTSGSARTNPTNTT